MVVTCLTVHPRRSLRLGIPARELAFHSSFAKRRDQAVRSSRQIGPRSQVRVRRVRYQANWHHEFH